MKKKVLSFMLALMLLIPTFSLSFARAVTPADPLIASALYSFLVSAGIKLWRDGIEGSDTAIDDMVDDMQTVWGYYKDDRGANVPSWSNIAGISTSNGDIILTNDTAQTFQSFADWMADYYSMVPNGTYAVSQGSDPGGSALLYTLPPAEAASLPRLQAGYWALPAAATGVSTYTINDLTYNRPHAQVEYIAPGAVMYIAANDQQPGYYSITVISNTTFQRRNAYYKMINGEWALGQFGSYSNSSKIKLSGNYFTRCNGTLEYYYMLDSYTDATSVTPSIPSNVTNESQNNASMSEIAYVLLYGDAVGSQVDLFATIGPTLADKVRDLLDGQSLAIDVGASAGAMEEDVIGVAAEGYSIPATADVIPSAIAYPLPISGVQELYPQAESAIDVGNLGLPDLGKALTSRFPFCIPWDIVYLYGSLNAQPVRPVIDIDILPLSFKQKIGITQDTSFTFDLGDPQYALAVKLVRWSTLFGFVLVLALTTKRLIWTTGG